MLQKQKLHVTNNNCSIYPPRMAFMAVIQSQEWLLYEGDHYVHELWLLTSQILPYIFDRRNGVVA